MNNSVAPARPANAAVRKPSRPTWAPSDPLSNYPTAASEAEETGPTVPALIVRAVRDCAALRQTYAGMKDDLRAQPRANGLLVVSPDVDTVGVLPSAIELARERIHVLRPQHYRIDALMKAATEYRETLERGSKAAMLHYDEFEAELRARFGLDGSAAS